MMAIDQDALAHVQDVGRPTHTALGGSAKRIVDIVGSLLLIVFFAPLFFLIWGTIKLRNPGPALYYQERIGFRGRKFRCLKFRTMVVNSPEVLADLLARDEGARREWMATQKLRDDPRITAIGRLLRESSLDELPQLLNVLRGDMSLVGPRPIVDEEAQRYGLFLGDYLSARPGMTGLWQVSGRSNVDYERRVRLDSSYVRSWSLPRDVGILMQTVRVVFAREGSC